MKNIFIIVLSSITLFLGFNFLTFIDRSFIELNEKNLQYLLILNILLLLLLFVFIFLKLKDQLRLILTKMVLNQIKDILIFFTFHLNSFNSYFDFFSFFTLLWRNILTKKLQQL